MRDGRRGHAAGTIVVPVLGELWCQAGAKGSWSRAYHPDLGVMRKRRQIARLDLLDPAEVAPERDS